MTPTPHHPRPDDCSAFEQTVQAVLDRELPDAALDQPHAMACEACRELATSARLFLVGMKTLADPVPSPDLTNCILAAVVSDQRSLRRQRLATWLVGSAVAASLAVLAVVFLTRDGATARGPVALPTPAPTPPPVRVSDQFAEAGSALASMTKHATERAIPPSAVVPAPEVAALPRVAAPPELDPATDSLTALSTGAQSGLQPMTDTTRRAVNLFLRDFSFVSAAKPKS